MPRVLVVEDDKYLNKLISDRLSLEGFEVKSVLDGETAFYELKGSERPYDILLSDMLLPKMMGAELFSKIREDGILPSLKIVAMSGIYKDPQQIQEISNLHQLTGYWVKPFSLDELISTLSGTPAAPTKQMRGSLAEISLERLFLRAYDEGLTGEISLKTDSLERKIFFSGGFPVGASSTSITESLGQSLKSMGLLSAEKQEEASKRMVEEGLQFGQMLIKMEALTQPQLFEGLRKHTYRLLLNSFLMKDGEFEIKPMAELPSYVLPLEFNPMLLILRAHRAFYSTELLKDLYAQKMHQFGQLKPRAFQILPLLNLDKNSMAFFQSFSATADFESILCAVPEIGYESLHRVLFLLESIGLLEWHTQPNDDPRIATEIVDFKKNTDSEHHADVSAHEAVKTEYMELLGKNYFQILEISEVTSESEVEQAYRTIRFRLHPDRYTGKLNGEGQRILDDMLSRIDKAYQTLLDADLRKKYLAGLRRQREDSAMDSKNYLKAQEIFREGQRLLGNQNYKAAQEQFRKAAEAWKKGSEYALYYLFAQFKQAGVEQKTQEQEVLLEKILKHAGNHPTQDIGFLLLGHAYQATGQIDQAKISYQKALSINEKNDEAAIALAKIGDKDFKKARVSRAIQGSKSRIKRYAIYGLLIFTAIIVYQERDRFLSHEEGISELEPVTLEAQFPVRSIRTKGEIVKIVVKEDWVKEVPDSILQSKCIQSLDKLQNRGILRIYIYDEKYGVKAQCTRERLQRY